VKEDAMPAKHTKKSAVTKKKAKGLARTRQRKPKSLPPIRRVVTGLDAQGRSIVALDEISHFSFSWETAPDFGATDVWRTHEMPVDNLRPGEHCTLPFTVEPPNNGSVCRIAQFPPDKTYLERWKKAGGLAALSGAKEHKGARHASMHTTRSLDYAIIIEGEIYALLDVGEVKLKKGDVLVQRGTNHGWSNRSNKPCLICFVLIDSLPLPAKESAA
jgi:hypothetical protein